MKTQPVPKGYNTLTPYIADLKNLRRTVPRGLITSLYFHSGENEFSHFENNSIM